MYSQGFNLCTSSPRCSLPFRPMSRRLLKRPVTEPAASAGSLSTADALPGSLRNRAGCDGDRRSRPEPAALLPVVPEAREHHRRSEHGINNSPVARGAVRALGAPFHVGLSSGLGASPGNGSWWTRSPRVVLTLSMTGAATRMPGMDQPRAGKSAHFPALGTAREDTGGYQAGTSPTYSARNSPCTCRRTASGRKPSSAGDWKHRSRSLCGLHQ